MNELEKAVRRWLKLRHQIAALEEKRDDLRPQIEAALLKAKDNSKSVAGVLLTYKEEFSRRFNEKRARERFGDNEIDALYDATARRSLKVKQ